MNPNEIFQSYQETPSTDAKYEEEELDVPHTVNGPLTVPVTPQLQKRLNDKIIYIRNKVLFVDFFKNQREKIVSMASDPKNVESLFENFEEYSEIDAKPILSSDVTYSSDFEIVSSLLLLSHLLINLFLVEVSLRGALQDQQFLQKFPESLSIYHQRLLSDIPKSENAHEIYKELAEFYDKDKLGVPEDYAFMVKNLDQQSVLHLIREFKSNDDFFSLQYYREMFHYYKSGDFLNYEQTDLHSSTKSVLPVYFNSIERNSSEVLQKIIQAFDAYAVSQNHLELLIDVTQSIFSSHKYTPTVEVFKVLMDKFGEHGLNNYQTIAYNCLPQYKHMPISLAENNGKPGPRFYYQFQHLIEEVPEFLNTLLSYLLLRNDKVTFLELLKFFRLRANRDYENYLNKSKYRELISRSSFAYAYNCLRIEELANEMPLIFTTDDPMIVSIDSIFKAIEGCIKFKRFEFIDPLFNNLVIFILNPNKCNGKKLLPLSLGSTSEILDHTNHFLLLAEDLSLDDYSNIILDKTMMKLLLEASKESDDIGRLLWIIPHLDRYLQHHLSTEECVGHIKKFAAKNFDTDFQDNESSMAIDTELIRLIYDTCTHLKVDGKVNTYNKILHFDSLWPVYGSSTCT